MCSMKVMPKNTEGEKEDEASVLFFIRTGIDDLPEDFLIDVVELEETLLLTHGCGQGLGGVRD